MLSRPLTLNESDDRGRGLAAVTPPPALPLADEGDDDGTQTGTLFFVIVLLSIYLFIVLSFNKNVLYI